MSRVVVVGSGVAGLFAALQANKIGAKVALVAGRAGATSLGSGAWDAAPAEADPGGDEDPRVLVALLADAPIVLESARVVTSAGVVRACRGRAEQVLALNPLAPIVVPRMQLAGWDAEAMATSVDESVRPSGGGARVVEDALLDDAALVRLSLAELALRLDEPGLLEAFALRLRVLRASIGDAAQILLPPMLGVAPQTIRRLREVAGAGVGEALSEPGGVVVHRTRAWSRAALASAGVAVEEGEVRRVAEGRVTLEGGRVVAAERIVLALGGLLTAGLVYRTAEHDLASSSVAPVRLGVVVDREPAIVPVLDGRPIDPVGSLYGADADRWFGGSSPAIERAGLAVDERGAVLDRDGQAVPWLFAAGDLVAAGARTLLGAAFSGVRAGRGASA